MADNASYSPALTALLALDLALVLAAGAWLYRRRHGLAARALGLAGSPLPLAPWRPSELFLAGACILCGAIVGQQVTALAAKHWFGPEEYGETGFFQIVAGAGFQLGLLGGLALARSLLRAGRAESVPPPPPAPPAGGFTAGAATVLRGGFMTFAVALLGVFPASVLWQGALRALGVDAPPQDLVSLFLEAGDTASLVFLIAMAVGVAPVAEELLFRAGIFRWLRTRTLRGVALLLPAFLFAVMHGYLAVLLPLLILALVLALGYEHYGHIGVPILAHALFNLHTIALLLAGFPA